MQVKAGFLKPLWYK